MWRFRRYMRAFRWMLVAVYAALMLVMERSPLYAIQRLEVVGGSTGWYRARLIESAFEHLDEWWLGGTDTTRHWMSVATAINESHTDLTNHYLAIGVMGGLPLMLLFIACLAKGFSFIGRALKRCGDESSGKEFMLWAFGCSLTAHVMTCFSVSYFDQSFLFLYLTLAVIASVGAASVRAEPELVAARFTELPAMDQPEIKSRGGRDGQPPTWKMPSTHPAPSGIKAWSSRAFPDDAGIFRPRSWTISEASTRREPRTPGQ
jgi:hypothetical protein